MSARERNVDIALHMGVTENTVRTYLKRVMEKLDCHNRAEAASLATKRGLL